MGRTVVAAMKTPLLCRQLLNSRNRAEMFSTTVLRSSTSAAVKENPHHRNRDTFDQEKLFINMGTLGAPHHGKTTLTSAITRVLSSSNDVTFLDIHDIDHTAVEKEAKHSHNTKHLEWWTDDWFVAHSDLPGLLLYVKNTLAPLPTLDVAFLCVRADLGVAKETLIHYHVAKHFGVPTILPFINVGTDEDEELVDLVKMELEESLDAEAMSKVVVGNAAAAQTGNDESAVSSIIDVFKNDLKLRPRDLEAPFLLHVESSGEIPNKGLFSGGRVVQGVAKGGDNLEVFVGGITSKVVYRDVEIFRKILPELRAGHRGGGFLKKANKVVEIKRGSLIYSPEIIKDGWKAARNWKIKVRGIPGQGDLTLSNRIALHHRGNSESVTTTSRTISDSEETEIEVALKQEILAKLGDPVVIRTDDSFILGHLVDGF